MASQEAMVSDHELPGGRQRGSGGRPTVEAARELRERILDIATDMMLSQGYGATSIEAISKRAGISKRTFYHRFEDKAALMSAVVVRIIDVQRPQSYTRLNQGAGLEERLIELGDLILQAALSPRVVQLRRLMVAEAERFPELAAAVAKAGGRQEAETLILGILRDAYPRVPRADPDLQFAAQQFLQLVVTLPQSRALGLGPSLSPTELKTWVLQSVRFFLKGFEGFANSAK